MITAIRSRIPFLDENPYPTVKEHVKEKLKRKQGIKRGVTAQELTASLPYGINTVTARLKELREENKIHVFNKRECDEMNHDRTVNAYRLRWRY